MDGYHEKERLVIASTVCPVCKAEPRIPCFYTNRWQQPVVMSRPHKQRVRKYDAERAGQ